MRADYFPATVRAWEQAWDRFISFLDFKPEVCKIIYTTNTIESLNDQLRKVIKNHGHFPTDAAVVKLLWLATRDIKDKPARARTTQAGRPKDQPRTAFGKLVESQTITSWKATPAELAMVYPDRLNPHP